VAINDQPWGHISAFYNQLGVENRGWCRWRHGRGPIRIERPGAWFHITARGNERRAIYLDARDRRRFLELLAGVVERFRLRLHAYVLMDNHFHLLVEAPEPNLPRPMQWLNVS